MDKQKYIDDLRDIKDIMSKSSKFISLSGLSGVFAGIFALVGAWAAYERVYSHQEDMGYGQLYISAEDLMMLLLIALTTLILALGTAVFFTARKTKQMRQRLWDAQTQRLFLNLAIPLFAGGVLCLIFLSKGYVGIIAPLTLIFYGLALVNASKYTLNEIRSLGILEVILGLLAAYFVDFGLLFWAVGFGILHIVYGIMMQIRYRS